MQYLVFLGVSCISKQIVLKKKQSFIWIRDWPWPIICSTLWPPISVTHVKTGQGSSSPMLPFHRIGKQNRESGGRGLPMVTKRLWLKFRCLVVHDYKLLLCWNLPSLPKTMWFMEKFIFNFRLIYLLSEWDTTIDLAPNPEEKIGIRAGSL